MIQPKAPKRLTRTAAMATLPFVMLSCQQTRELSVDLSVRNVEPRDVDTCRRALSRVVMFMEQEQGDTRTRRASKPPEKRRSDSSRCISIENRTAKYA